MARDLSRETFLAHRDRMRDAKRATKLYDVPDVIAGWLEPFGGFEGKRVLDFGCGFGETAAGIALGHRAAEVHGVDVQDKPGQCLPLLRDAFGLDQLPANLRFSQIVEGRSLGQDAYDVIVSWSVLEHVSRQALSGVLSDLHRALTPDGVAFLQISPLYFSPEGAHLWPLGYGRWEHLLKQTSEVLDDIAACEDVDDARKARMTRMFTTLNRVTASDLVQRCSDAGFRIVREQRDRTDLVPPPELLDAYAPDALVTHQIVLLVQRA